MATKSKHKYRVSIYLGKELYTQLEQMANIMGVSVATITKIVLNTGYEFARTMDKKLQEKGGNTNGENKQP